MWKLCRRVSLRMHWILITSGFSWCNSGNTSLEDEYPATTICDNSTVPVVQHRSKLSKSIFFTQNGWVYIETGVLFCFLQFTMPEKAYSKKKKTPLQIIYALMRRLALSNLLMLNLSSKTRSIWVFEREERWFNQMSDRVLDPEYQDLWKTDFRINGRTFVNAWNLWRFKC